MKAKELDKKFDEGKNVLECWGDEMQKFADFCGASFLKQPSPATGLALMKAVIG